jgi:hypothetical protein
MSEKYTVKYNMKSFRHPTYVAKIIKFEEKITTYF